MRTLYTFDKHNYSDDMEVFERFAVRAVIIRDGKLAMQQAGEGYYKILGGGIDAGETNEVALAREVRDTVLHFGADHVCHVPLSQSDLADLTLCSREQVNRLLKKWEKRGIVRHHDRILRIDDVAALSALACDADHSG